ncbi:hypothetical protein WJX73_005455 [Symbiochloris irregularis]|uniref:Uncharacterized protein n=1 Tax=Symbiochloris irregularis TaxID=706552 RepID=A0AAW1P0N5_9CHLO
MAQGSPKQTGYTEKDSAGQTNIYPVMTKAYVQGSTNDSTTGSKANNAIAAVAGIITLAAISLGIVAAKSSISDNFEDTQAQVGLFRSLSEYKDKFSAES